MTTPQITTYYTKAYPSSYAILKPIDIKFTGKNKSSYTYLVDPSNWDNTHINALVSEKNISYMDGFNPTHPLNNTMTYKELRPIGQTQPEGYIIPNYQTLPYGSKSQKGVLGMIEKYINIRYIGTSYNDMTAYLTAMLPRAKYVQEQSVIEIPNMKGGLL